MVARPAHQPDRHNSGDHGSVLNQPKAVICSRDLLSRQVTRRRYLVSRAALNHRIVYCPRRHKNTFRADLGGPVYSTAFSNRPIPRLRLQRRVGHRPDLPTRICCSTEKPFVSFVHASAPNKPSSRCPVLSGCDRNCVYRLSLLFKPLDGGIHQDEWKREEYNLRLD